MAEPYLSVNVLVCQIDAACKGRMTVNDADFSVIPVILVGGQGGPDGGKHFAFNPLFPKRLRVGIGKQHQAAHAVVHNADLHTLPDLFLQDLQDAVPHFSPLHNKILHKNEMLRRFQAALHLYEHIVSQREILGRCILIDRTAGKPVHVAHQVALAGAHLVKALCCLRVLLQIRRCLGRRHLQSVADKLRADLKPHEQIKQRSEYRKNKNRDDP